MTRIRAGSGYGGVAATIGGTGIVGRGAPDTICSGNHVFSSIGACEDGGDNASN